MVQNRLFVNFRERKGSLSCNNENYCNIKAKHKYFSLDIGEKIGKTKKTPQKQIEYILCNEWPLFFNHRNVFLS